MHGDSLRALTAAREPDPADRDPRPFVNLIDQHGTEAVLNAVDHLAPDAPHVTTSTAHRAQDREWVSVKIVDHFTALKNPKNADRQDANGNLVVGPIDDAEARLTYFAVTHTRDCLDLGGLFWVDRHPGGHQYTPKLGA